MVAVTHVNNIFNIKVNSIANNGSINFGNVIHKGHQSNVKANIGYAHAGDLLNSPRQGNNANLSKDPDVVDQQQSQV